MKNATHCLKKCYAIVVSLALVLSLFQQTLTMTAFGAEVKSIDECDLSDFSNWRSGTYEQVKGTYTVNTSRICLNDYKRVTPGRTYVAHIPNLGKEYYFAVRQLTSDKKMVESIILQDGDGFTANPNASYVGVSFYNAKQSGITFQDYKNLFQNGCKLSFSISADGKTVRDPNMTGPVSGFDWSDLSYWRIGMYQAPTGNYTFYQPRICLNAYVNATPGATYQLESSADGRYYMQIREMSADNKFIQSVFLGKGNSFVATDNTAYLAVSIGDGKGDHGNYQQYLKLFQEGWKIRLMKQGGTQKPSSGGSEASKPESGSASSSVAPSSVIPSSVAPSTPSNVVPSTPSSATGKGTSYDLSAENNWKVGMYSFVDGKYTYTSTRICLKDYITCEPNATYQLESSADSKYYMSIRQMTADKKFISSIFAGKGETFKVAANAAYLGVTIQNGKGDHWGYEDYKAQFDMGWKIRLICKDAGGESQKPSFDDDVENEDLTGGTDVPSSGNDITSMPSTKPVVPSTPSAVSSTPSVAPSTPSKASVASSAPSKASVAPSVVPSVAPSTPTVLPSTPSVAPSVVPSTPAQNTSIDFLKSEMKRIVMTGSTEKIDIYRYNLKYAEMHKIWEQTVETDFDLKVAASCYAVMDFDADKDAKGIVKNIFLAYPEDGFQKRYQNALANMQKMHHFIEQNREMTDLDKIIYIHDYIVLHNFYRATNTAIDYSGGAALAGEGSVCQGYRVAMGLMLESVNIDTSVITNNGHTWNYVKLDGQWYHLDATWAEGQPITHVFLIRNDAEFAQPLGGRAHRAWTNKDGYSSTSTKYTNWFVHNINGIMCYGGGYWYYKDGTKLMKAKSDGSDIQIVGDDTTAGVVLDPDAYTAKYFMKNY